MNIIIFTILAIMGGIMVISSLYILLIYVKEFAEEFVYKRRINRERRIEETRRRFVESQVIDIIKDLDGIKLNELKISTSYTMSKNLYYVCIYKLKDDGIVFPAMFTFDLELDGNDSIKAKKDIRIKIINEYIIPKQIKHMIDNS